MLARFVLERKKIDKLLKEMSYTRLIALSFLVVILVGTILLMLPISARNETMTPVLDALFTATSATCVIGFVVQDTFQYWSVFGQLVILVLIQIGALGFVTLVSMFAIFAKKRIVPGCGWTGGAVFTHYFSDTNVWRTYRRAVSSSGICRERVRSPD